MEKKPWKPGCSVFFFLRDIFIGSSDQNTVTDMEFEYIDIFYGDQNTIQYCSISNGYTTLIYLFQANDTYIYRTYLCGVDDDDTGIYIKDSQDVEIDGYESGEDPSEIDNCYRVLRVESVHIASSVFFHHYEINEVTDPDDYEDDVYLTGNPSHSTKGTYNTLTCDTGLDEYDDAYSTWTEV